MHTTRFLSNNTCHDDGGKVGRCQRSTSEGATGIPFRSYLSVSTTIWPASSFPTGWTPISFTDLTLLQSQFWIAASRIEISATETQSGAYSRREFRLRLLCPTEHQVVSLWVSSARGPGPTAADQVLKLADDPLKDREFTCGNRDAGGSRTGGLRQRGWGGAGWRFTSFDSAWKQAQTRKTILRVASRYDRKHSRKRIESGIAFRNLRVARPHVLQDVPRIGLLTRLASALERRTVAFVASSLQ